MRESIVSKTTKNIGAIALIKPVLDALGVRETVDRYCPMDRNREITHGQAVEVMVMNRLTSPTPLCHVEEWAALYALEEACGIEADQVNDDRLARALDAAFPRMEDIEADIALRAMEKYRVDPSLIHFDTTSLYFEGAYDESDIIRLGYSRDQKPDKKQINLALNVSAGEGIPFSHSAYQGNAPDPKIVIDNVKRLKARLKPNHFIMVGDRTSITAESVALLLDSDLDFLGALKTTNPYQTLIASIGDDEYAPVEYQGEAMYRACERTLTLSHAGRSFTVRGIIVWSMRKAEEGRRRRTVAVEKLLAKLKILEAKLNSGRCKKRPYVERKIATVLAGSRYGNLVKVELKGEDGGLTMTVNRDEKALQRASRLDGKYILATSLNWSASQVIQTYMGRYIVEARIRNMKSNLAVRPIFLHSDQRVQALVAVTVLALMVYSILEVLARRSGMAKMTARQLLFHFQKLILIKLTMKDSEHVNIVEDVTRLQAELLAKLSLPQPEAYITT
jgi:transposase